MNLRNNTQTSLFYDIPATSVFHDLSVSRHRTTIHHFRGGRSSWEWPVTRVPRVRDPPTPTKGLQVEPSERFRKRLVNDPLSGQLLLTLHSVLRVEYEFPLSPSTYLTYNHWSLYGSRSTGTVIGLHWTVDNPRSRTSLLVVVWYLSTGEQKDTGSTLRGSFKTVFFDSFLCYLKY